MPSITASSASASRAGCRGRWARRSTDSTPWPAVRGGGGARTGSSRACHASTAPDGRASAIDAARACSPGDTTTRDSRFRWPANAATPDALRSPPADTAPHRHHVRRFHLAGRRLSGRRRLAEAAPVPQAYGPVYAAEFGHERGGIDADCEGSRIGEIRQRTAGDPRAPQLHREGEDIEICRESEDDVRLARARRSPQRQEVLTQNDHRVPGYTRWTQLPHVRAGPGQETLDDRVPLVAPALHRHGQHRGLRRDTQQLVDHSTPNARGVAGDHAQQALGHALFHQLRWATFRGAGAASSNSPRLPSSGIPACSHAATASASARAAIGPRRTTAPMGQRSAAHGCRAPTSRRCRSPSTPPAGPTAPDAGGPEGPPRHRPDRRAHRHGPCGSAPPPARAAGCRGDESPSSSQGQAVA